MKTPNNQRGGMQWQGANGVCGILKNIGINAVDNSKLRSELEREAARYAEINSIPMLMAAKKYSETVQRHRRIRPAP
jgi:hypothetical protein